MKYYRFVIGFVVLAGWLAIVGCGGGDSGQPSVSPTPDSGASQETTTPAAPSETTPAAPSETTPAAPSETTPAAPSETTPAAPSESAPTAPGEPATPSAEPTTGTSGWGHLKGRFVYDGVAPTPTPLVITKDQEVCGQHQLVDESLVVNSQNQGVANVVLYPYVRRGQQAPTPHESYEQGAAAPVELDNHNCRFSPRVCVLRMSQTLVVKNSDPVGHNTKIDTLDNPAFNQTIPQGSSINQQFTATERRPAPVSCSIHPWMRAWLVVQDTPYVAVTDENGAFEIKNLPVGTWTFQAWHELAESITQVTMDGQSKEWSRGRFEVTIQPDATTDLGEVKLNPSVFQR